MDDIRDVKELDSIHQFRTEFIKTHKNLTKIETEDAINLRKFLPVKDLNVMVYGPYQSKQGRKFFFISWSFWDDTEVEHSLFSYLDRLGIAHVTFQKWRHEQPGSSDGKPNESGDTKGKKEEQGGGGGKPKAGGSTKGKKEEPRSGDDKAKEGGKGKKQEPGDGDGKPKAGGSDKGKKQEPGDGDDKPKEGRSGKGKKQGKGEGKGNEEEKEKEEEKDNTVELDHFILKCPHNRLLSIMYD